MTVSGGVHGHGLFDGHVDLDLPASGEDPLSGNKPVQPRIAGAGTDIGRQQHVEDPEVFQPRPPFGDDVTLHLRDLHVVLQKVLGGIAALHQIGRHGENGRQRPQPPPVVPVTEAGDILPFLRRPVFSSQGIR